MYHWISSLGFWDWKKYCL